MAAKYHYEFDEAQNKIIRGMAGPTSIVGWIIVLAGVLGMLGAAGGVFAGYQNMHRANAAADAEAVTQLAANAAQRDRPGFTDRTASIEAMRASKQKVLLPVVVGGVLAFIEALFTLALGRSLRGAASAFRKITTTQGDDLTLLIDGVSELTGAYSVGRIFVIYTIAATLITCVWLAASAGTMV